MGNKNRFLYTAFNSLILLGCSFTNSSINSAQPTPTTRIIYSPGSEPTITDAPLDIDEKGSISQELVSTKPLWSFEVPGGVKDKLVSWNNERLYAFSGENILYVFDMEGNLLWQYEDDEGFIVSSPVVDFLGNIYIVNSLSSLFSINLNGEISWVYKIESSKSRKGPVISEKGEIYYFVQNNSQDYIHAVSTNGENIWVSEVNPVSYANNIQVNSSGNNLIFGKEVIDAVDGAILQIETSNIIPTLMFGGERIYAAHGQNISIWNGQTQNLDFIYSMDEWSNSDFNNRFLEDMGVNEKQQIWFQFGEDEFGVRPQILWLDFDTSVLGMTTFPPLSWIVGRNDNELIVHMCNQIINIDGKPQFSENSLDCFENSVNGVFRGLRVEEVDFTMDSPGKVIHGLDLYTDSFLFLVSPKGVIYAIELP